MIKQIKTEVDSYSEIPENILLMAYNTAIRQLYRGVIKDEKAARYTPTTYNDGAGDSYSMITLTNADDNKARIEFEDVEKVKVGSVTYTRCTAKGSEGFEKFYYKGDATSDGYDTILLEKLVSPSAVATVYYDEAPKAYTDITTLFDTEDMKYIPLPNEYVPMIYAAVRGEAYKWVNEDALSAKWISDYNAQLAGFSEWIKTTKPQYGG